VWFLVGMLVFMVARKGTLVVANSLGGGISLSHCLEDINGTGV
jgi:hypothetical protein